MNYHRWLFSPLEMHTPEQSSAWWKLCFWQTPELEQFVATDASAGLLACAGNGKSIAMEVLHRNRAQDCFIVDYPAKNWPSGERPWVKDENHVSQIMAASASLLLRQLQTAAQTVHKLDNTQIEFLNWLVNRFLTKRNWVLFYRSMLRELDGAGQYLEPIQDLYSEHTNEAETWGMLSEVAELVQALGFRQILVVVDLNAFEAQQHYEELLDLLGWLHLMEHPGWALKITLPEAGVMQSQLKISIDGRLRMYRLYYNEVKRTELVKRYLSVATDGHTESLAQLATRDVIQKAEQTILDLYQQDSVGGWLDWTQTLLSMHGQDARLPLSDVDAAAVQFYTRFVPLRLDCAHHGVWRGPQFLVVDGLQFDVLKKLFELKGDFRPQALAESAGSSQNLNTIMSRLRRVVEPLKGHNIYIQNRRDYGYWLQNSVF